MNDLLITKMESNFRSCNEKKEIEEESKQEEEEEDIHNSTQLSSSGDELQMNSVIPVTYNI